MVAFLMAAVIAVSTSDADAAYTAKDYVNAAALYARLVVDEPTNAQAWYRLGVSDLELHRTDDAMSALAKALSLGYDAMSVHYRLAGAASQARNAALAVSELELAIRARPIPIEAITADNAFAPIATDPQFTAFIEEQSRATHPCRYNTAYHALDFWIGDWTVTSAGNAAGTSHIEAAADGCAILEQWTGTYDAPGRSISAYDPSLRRWTQRYVSGRGNVTNYVGTVLPGGSVQLFAAGASILTRMTYTHLANGSVRQRFETSANNGKTWSAPNDLIYTRSHA